MCHSAVCFVFLFQKRDKSYMDFMFQLEIPFKQDSTPLDSQIEPPSNSNLLAACCDDDKKKGSLPFERIDCKYSKLSTNSVSNVIQLQAGILFNLVSFSNYSLIPVRSDSSQSNCERLLKNASSPWFVLIEIDQIGY